MPIQRLGQFFTPACNQHTRNKAAVVTCFAVTFSAAAWRSVSASNRPVEVRHAISPLGKTQLPPAVETTPSLPPWLISVLSGAVGECVGQCVLYPVDTVKVLCQKHSQGAFTTLRTMLRAHGPIGTVISLYHGVGTTIFVSMALGAVYLGVFQAATRALSRMAPFQAPPVLGPASITTDFVKGTSKTGKDSKADCTSLSDSSRHGQPQAALVAALLTSVVMAMLTGPLEMAKNRVQAGLVAEPLLQYTVSGRGIRDTLPFMAPFMAASAPHDFAELVLYFQGHKQLEKLPDDSWPKCWIRQEALDAMLGAFAGACAVFLSMPADCMKTKVLTNYVVGGGAYAGGPCSSGGVRNAWVGAVRSTAAGEGPRGFFVGFLPRAVDEVPGSMLHWTFAESCTRWLEKF